MAKYTPRHGAPRHAKKKALASSLRRPVVGSTITLALVATVGATIATGDPLPAEASPLAAVSTTRSATPAVDQRTADVDRLAADRRTANESRSASREKERLDAAARKKKAAADKKKRAAAAKKKARERTERELAQIAKDPKPYAVEMMRERGWTDDQWGCLDALWVGESNWDHTATNPSSGAYGIPQSLPANKMATAGADWKTNPLTQIEWGLDYIQQSYGSPCQAWSFWNSQNPHWY